MLKILPPLMGMILVPKLKRYRQYNALTLFFFFKRKKKKKKKKVKILDPHVIPTYPLIPHHTITNISLPLSWPATPHSSLSLLLLLLLLLIIFFFFFFFFFNIFGFLSYFHWIALWYCGFCFRFLGHLRLNWRFLT